MTTRVCPSQRPGTVAIMGFEPYLSGLMSWLLTKHEIYLLREGTHGRLYEKLGAHTLPAASGEGVRFAVWAPNAEGVSAIGEFNDWRPGINPLALREDESGIWEGVVRMAAPGQRYKYHVRSRFNNYRVNKADPFAFCCETPPGTASIIRDLAYPWGTWNGYTHERRKTRSMGPFRSMRCTSALGDAR